MLFESLESRTFLSATSPVIQADIAVLRTQGAAVRTELSLALKTAVADATVIRKDLVRLDTLKIDRSLLNSLNQTQRADIAKLKKEANFVINTGQAQVNRVVSAYNQLQHHTGSVVLQAKLSAAIAVLQTEINTAQQEVVPAGTVVITDGDVELDAIATANPTDTQTQSDIGTAKTDLSNNVQTIESGVTLLLTDVSTVLTAIEPAA